MFLFLDTIQAGWDVFDDVERSLEGMYGVLCPDEPATMRQRAEQQLFALLLNMVSGKVGLGNAIDLSEADLTAMYPDVTSWPATVSDAITFCTENLEINSELAKDVADTLNNGIGYV